MAMKIMMMMKHSTATRKHPDLRKKGNTIIATDGLKIDVIIDIPTYDSIIDVDEFVSWIDQLEPLFYLLV